MKYKLNISLTDEDYLEYNKFYSLRSPYGKKTLNSIRLLTALIILLFIIMYASFNAFSLNSLYYIIPLLAILLIFEFFIPSFLMLAVKANISRQRKTGQLGFTPFSVIEFHDEGIVEISEHMRLEQKYSAMDRIFVVDNKVIYIFTSHLGGYILPVSSFESNAQYAEFLEFIATKCPNISFCSSK